MKKICNNNYKRINEINIDKNLLIFSSNLFKIWYNEWILIKNDEYKCNNLSNINLCNKFYRLSFCLKILMVSNDNNDISSLILDFISNKLGYKLISILNDFNDFYFVHFNTKCNNIGIKNELYVYSYLNNLSNKCLINKCLYYNRRKNRYKNRLIKNKNDYRNHIQDTFDSLHTYLFHYDIL